MPTINTSTPVYKYFFKAELLNESLDLQDDIETLFHEDMYQFCMEQDIASNGANSVYFS